MKKEKNTHTFDVIVIGAGPAGSAAAAFIRERGFTVALIEQNRFENAGPAWVNGMVPEAFDRAGLARPQGKECELADFPIVMASRKSDRRVEIPGRVIWNISMPRLIARLLSMAKKGGVKLFPETRADRFILEGERPAVLKTVRKGKRGDGPLFRAALFVDASGSDGLLGGIPALSACSPHIAGDDLCIARQEDCRIADRDGARRFLDSKRIGAGTMYNLLGSAGGYSTMTVHVYPDLKTVGLLAGSIYDERCTPGPDMIRNFKAENPWVGKTIAGGSGLIPLRHPRVRLVAPGIALVGNAACQVFPVHGSGVGNGLYAARLLADAVDGRGDPGAEEVLWSYACRFQREVGSVLASYDLFRKASQKLDEEHVGRMFSLGLLNEEQAVDGLRQVMPQVSLKGAAGALAAFVRAPLFVGELLPVLAKMPRVHSHYRNYPDRPDRELLEKWARVTGKLTGYR